jgi:hypothetical protein
VVIVPGRVGATSKCLPSVENFPIMTAEEAKFTGCTYAILQICVQVNSSESSENGRKKRKVSNMSPGIRLRIRRFHYFGIDLPY